MPLIMVRYKKGCLSDEEVDVLVKEILPREIAQALHIEERQAAHLTPGDLEVWTSTVGPHDVQAHDVAIVVFANDYKERRVRQEQATKQIASAVEAVLGKVSVSAYIWTLLVPGEFVEFGKQNLAEPPRQRSYGV